MPVIHKIVRNKKTDDCDLSDLPGPKVRGAKEAISKILIANIGSLIYNDNVWDEAFEKKFKCLKYKKTKFDYNETTPSSKKSSLFK